MMFRARRERAIRPMCQPATLVLGILAATLVGCSDDRSIEAHRQGTPIVASSDQSTTHPSPPVQAIDTIESCASCHGQSGEGDSAKLAPSLAGMPKWYLNKQMSMFIDGRRRPLPDGGDGDQMVRMLKEIDPTELERAASHYSKLAPIKIKNTFGGDAKQGRSIYWGKGACINCHLFNGQGDEASGAPPITIIPDWYFLRQMRAFREGQRAAHTNDEVVRCMVVAASRLNEKERMDVGAYLAELAKGRHSPSPSGE